jgi:uncharacterized protein
MVFHSSFQFSYLWLPLLGLAVGLAGSMIGGGGGFVFPPALILFFKVPVHIAITTSLAATLPICLLGAAGHYRNGNLDLPTGLIFGTAGIAGALSGTIVTGLLSPEQLKDTFGVYIISIALLMMFNNHKDKKKTKEQTHYRDKHMVKRVSAGSFYGFAGGIVSGIFGTSGTAPVLAGLFAIKLPVRFIAGTSLLIIFINTVSALTGHLFLGVVDLTLVLFLTIGTIIGALTGPRLTVGLNIGKREAFIREFFVLLILAFGIIIIII